MAGVDGRPGAGQSGMSAHTGHALGVVGLGRGGPRWALEDGAVGGPPQVVAAAQDEVGLSVEGGAHLAQAAVAAGTLEAVLMPVLVQRLQQVAVLDLAVATRTALLLPFGLDGQHRHAFGWTDKRQMDTGRPSSSGPSGNGNPLLLPTVPTRVGVPRSPRSLPSYLPPPWA